MSEQSDHNFNLVNKFWEYPDRTLLFQIYGNRAKGDEAGERKKHLMIDLRQGSFGLRFIKEKPAAEQKIGTVAAMVRKYLLRTNLSACLKHVPSGDIWLIFSEVSSSPKKWYMQIKNSRPPLLNFIAPDAKSLLRFGMEGCFTKTQTFTEALPGVSSEEFVDYFSQLSADHGTGRAKGRPETAPQPDDQKPGEALALPQKTLRDRLKRRLKTLRGSLAKNEKSIVTADAVEKLKLEAELLAGYLHLVKSGSHQLQLGPAETGLTAEIQIPLDENMSPGQNLQKKFDKLKKLQKGNQILLKMVDEIQANISALERDIERLAQLSLPPHELSSLEIKYGLKAKASFESKKNRKEGHAEAASPFRLFDIPDMGKILVGKGPVENDVMTKKARANDLWLHVVTGTGTHVIIPKNGLAKGVSLDKIQYYAGVLAVHYSQFRAAREAEVYVTEKRFIKKQKGMPDGLWKVEHAQTRHIVYGEELLSELLHWRRE
jgi:hypothetical protein